MSSTDDKRTFKGCLGKLVIYLMIYLVGVATVPVVVYSLFSDANFARKVQSWYGAPKLKDFLKRQIQSLLRSGGKTADEEEAAAAEDQAPIDTEQILTQDNITVHYHFSDPAKVGQGFIQGEIWNQGDKAIAKLTLEIGVRVNKQTKTEPIEILKYGSIGPSGLFLPGQKRRFIAHPTILPPVIKHSNVWLKISEIRYSE